MDPFASPESGMIGWLPNTKRSQSTTNCEICRGEIERAGEHERGERVCRPCKQLAREKKAA